MVVKLKILVLGSTGFVGQSVYKLLESEFQEVFCLNRSDGHDLRTIDSYECLEEIEPDFVVNCVAHVGSLNYVSEHAGEVIYDNTRLVSAMYEAVRRFSVNSVIINPIANCAYPKGRDIFSEDIFEDGPLDESVFAYGATRRLMVEYSRAYRQQYNLKSCNFLVPNMYGPGDSSDPNKAHAVNAIISKFVASSKRESSVEIWGDGTPLREWLYVTDFARFVTDIIKMKRIPEFGDYLNVGQEKTFSIREIVEYLQEFHFSGVDVSYNVDMPNGAPKKCMSKKRFSRFFPNFRFTDWKDGIRETISYYESISTS